MQDSTDSKNGILFRRAALNCVAVRTITTSLCLACVSLGAPSEPTVRVSGGMIRGALTTGGGAVFKAIPYAQPPTGDLRWREPMPVKSWNGTRDATQFGAICPQNPSATIPNSADISNEDCLFLNVWTPEWPARSRRPVLFWVPGGGNVNGGTSESRHDGFNLSRRGLVVVTINYRLGSFGFFSHPALTRESRHKRSGNQGLLDQVAALEWVHANIVRFGGDPAEITLAGVSAGSIDISALMTSSLTAGRFKRHHAERSLSKSIRWSATPGGSRGRGNEAHSLVECISKCLPP